tara:strand:+ start:223 stop:909 length:687 start_codon:yes stop_codon:yes gene_type:complete
MSIRELFKPNKYWVLNNLEMRYDFKFDPIVAYLDNTQEMIHKQERELSEKYEEWNKEHQHDTEVPEAYDIFETEILNSSEFPIIMNHSIYLTIYSIFEKEFFNLCMWCQSAENLKIGPKDIKERNYLGQCHKFITLVLEVELTQLDNQWTTINKFQQIRNAIAHNNGAVKPTNSELITFINDSDGISIDERNTTLEIKSIEFLKYMIQQFSNFLLDTSNVIQTAKGNT